MTHAFYGRTRGHGQPLARQAGRRRTAAYPQVHHLTAPLRAHGRATGDPNLINLWAGEAHQLARAASAGEITRDLWRDAQAALTLR